MDQRIRFKTNQFGLLKKIGAFIIDTSKSLGKGSYGEVFECWHESNPNLKFACKMISIGALQGNNSIQQVVEEGRLLLKAQGTYIVPAITITQSESNIYYITELCNQGNLSEYLKANKDTINERFVLNIFKMICIGYYDCLYSKNIIHRDLKPENILIHNGIPLIADFGFAKALDDIEKMVDQSQKCTPMYASPQIFIWEEQCKYSYLTDIYSLGVMLYQMIYGYAPGDPKTRTDIQKYMKGIREKGPNKFIDFPENHSFQVSFETKQAIAKMMEYYEQDRITIKELINHKMFKLIEMEDMNQYQDDDISKSIQNSIGGLKIRGIQVTKIKSNKGATSQKSDNKYRTLEEVDLYYLFIRNIAIYSNIVLSNFYHIFPQCISLGIQEVYLDFLLLSLSNHYYLALQFCQDKIDIEKDEGMPFNPLYKNSDLYKFTKNNIVQECSAAKEQIKYLKEKILQKIETKYMKLYKDNPILLNQTMQLKAFLINNQQLHQVIITYKTLLKEQFIPQLTTILKNPPKELLNHQTFFRTIYSMILVHSDNMNVINYKNFKFDEFYQTFNRTALELVNFIKSYLKI